MKAELSLSIFLLFLIDTYTNDHIITLNQQIHSHHSIWGNSFSTISFSTSSSSSPSNSLKAMPYEGSGTKATHSISNSFFNDNKSVIYLTRLQSDIIKNSSICLCPNEREREKKNRSSIVYSRKVCHISVYIVIFSPNMKIQPFEYCSSFGFGVNLKICLNVIDYVQSFVVVYFN